MHIHVPPQVQRDCRSTPAGIQRSGVVAVVDTAGTPAMASVGGPRPPCAVHHPVRRPGSGCPTVRCPTRLVSSRPVSGHLGSSPGSGGPAVCCPPIQRPALWCPPVQRPAGCCPPRPSGRVHLVPHQAVALGTRSVRRRNRHHRNGPRSRWAAAPLSGSVDGPSRPGRRRRCGGRALVSRGVGGGPGVCERRRLTAERPGRPGRRAERRSLAAARGTGAGRGARWPTAARLPSPAGCATTVRGRRRA
jgi:hypothetical protein